MAYLWILALFALLHVPLPAYAFNKCDTIYANPGELAEFIYDRGVYDGPLTYFDAARAIRVETGPAPGGLIPHAGHDDAGAAVVYYPAAFPQVLCRIALATNLVLSSDNWRPFASSARVAAHCVDAGTPFDTCLVQFSRELEEAYTPDFIALDAESQSIAYSLYRQAAAQIGIHEFAHLVLDHHRQVSSGSLARIDAEFEADFYAVLNGTQIGEAPSAMYYFYKALADIESYSDTLNYQNYESGSCRATNIDDITGTFMMGPIVILDAASGGGAKLARSSPELLRSIVKELQERPPALSDESCGRLSNQVLQEAQDELIRLASSMADHGEMLFAPNRDTAKALALQGPEVYALVLKIDALTKDLVHLRSLAAQAVSQLILRIGYAGAEGEMAPELNRILGSAAGDLLARDYGRFLMVQGVGTLYNTGQPFSIRLRKAREIFQDSVMYAPDQSESWLNLAMISGAEGRCEDATVSAEKAVETAGDGSARDQSEYLRDVMRAAVTDGKCSDVAANLTRSFAGQ